MARIEAVTIPRWGMTMTEGTIVQWLADEGNTVERGQELVEIETTKVTNVVDSATTGVLRRIVLQAGTTAPVGALAGVIADQSASDEEIAVFVEGYASRLEAADGGDAVGDLPHLIEVDGGTINLLEAGPAGDETVLFLHGFGGDLTTWLFNQPAIAEAVRTVALDLPGHGSSSPIAEGDVFSKIDLAIEAAADAVAPGRLHLVGHSFGGGIAAAFAARRPERIASLTLIAPIGLGEAMDHSFLTDFVAADRRRPLLKVLERLFADPSKITNDMVEGTLRFKRLEGVPEALSAIADTIADASGQRQSIADRLGQLRCPVAIIWGASDKILPVPGEGELPPNVRLLVIPNAGHMPQMEASTEVNEAILETIRRD